MSDEKEYDNNGLAESGESEVQIFAAKLANAKSCLEFRRSHSSPCLNRHDLLMIAIERRWQIMNS